ncbi:MAG: Lrp/AsnC ligand binding domain-containing protein [Candidatus Thalassarchaeaceae archaeon]|jgi:DNA-binding Lrp family transcriptional regulator|nr:Lrp/AsnC ligand binding domain-containing protein [Candidatus Thalassarchaeaceae archaeon]|tara:strand:+ start:56958 stop:57299 length:342 start_codon:yes stop_codon:yes gene_type:complete
MIVSATTIRTSLDVYPHRLNEPFYEAFITLNVSWTIMAAGFVLINVEPGSEIRIQQEAEKFDFVSEANVLFGDHDLIVKVEAGSVGDIARLVVEKLRSLDGVTTTKTLACAEL